MKQLNKRELERRIINGIIGIISYLIMASIAIAITVVSMYIAFASFFNEGGWTVAIIISKFFFTFAILAGFIQGVLDDE